MLGAFPVVFLGLAVARRVHTASSRIVRDHCGENALSTLATPSSASSTGPRSCAPGWSRAQEIAAATPGLRLALIRVRDGVADADLRAGDWAAPLVCGPSGSEPSPLLTDAALDAGPG